MVLFTNQQPDALGLSSRACLHGTQMEWCQKAKLPRLPWYAAHVLKMEMPVSSEWSQESPTVTMFSLSQKPTSFTLTLQTAGTSQAVRVLTFPRVSSLKNSVYWKSWALLIRLLDLLLLDQSGSSL